MSNVDISLNRNRIIGLFLKNTNLLSVLKIEDFDKHFYFEEPVILTDGSFNTKISIFAKPESEYFGRKILRYNRLTYSDLPTIVVHRDAENTIYELIPKINEKYGLFLTSYDIFDNDLSPANTGDIQLDIKFKPTSLIYQTDGYIPWVIKPNGTWTDKGMWDDTAVWRDSAILYVFDQNNRWNDNGYWNDDGVWDDGV